jgi:lipid A oxidase
MRAAAGSAWTAEVFHDAPRRPRPRRAEALGALFAMAAMAAVVFPIVTEQTDDGAQAQGVAGGRPAHQTLAPPGRELMFAGYSGVPYTYPSDVTVVKSGLNDFTAHHVVWDGKPFVNPIYYGARIVRFGDGPVGTMLDFTHSKTIARLAEDVAFTGTLNGAPAPERATLRDVFRKLEASHGHNMLTLNGLLRLPRFGVRLQPYVGIGAGVSLPHSEVQFANAEKRTYEYQVAGFVGQALIGLELRTARVSYFLEYKYTLAPYDMPLSEREGTLLPFDLWTQFRSWWSGTEPPGGHLTTTFASHQGIFGLGIRSAPVVAAP